VTRCYGCKHLRGVFHYLCGDCFDLLPEPAQEALWARRDGSVVPLLRQVWEHLEHGRPLAKIRLEVANVR
jgi:hypothetical protein